MGMRVFLAVQMGMGVNQAAVLMHVHMTCRDAHLDTSQKPRRAEQNGAEQHDRRAGGDV